VAWGALGHATAAHEAAMAYCRQRQQFGKPLVSFQVVQDRLVIAEARDLLGGNGILLDFHVMRHLADIEAIHTYEGTETIQTLIVGRDITGASAFA
jgi:glutaryl-CoA dehydrogenase